MTQPHPEHTYPGARCQRGAMLIQLAVLLLFLGVVLAGNLSSFAQKMRNDKEFIATSNLVQIRAALEGFRRINGYYPCPAPWFMSNNFPQWGTAAGAYATPEDCANPAITSLARLWRDGVRWGPIPYKTLGLSADKVIDAHGYPLTYGVSTVHTSAVGFSLDGNSVIEVRDPYANDLLEGGHASWVVIDHGTDDVAPFSWWTGWNQKAPSPCLWPWTDYNSEVFLDDENCDLDHIVIIATPNTLRRENSPDNLQHYDDTAHFPHFSSSISPPTPRAGVSGVERAPGVGVGEAGPPSARA